MTVVVLSYNRPDFLKQSLQSILMQSYPKLEVIVIDNPSVQSDAVRAVVSEFLNVRLITMPSNRGYTGGMNQGIRRAQGEYIYLTEDDMITEINAVGALVSYMQQDPQCAIASGIHDDEAGTMVHAGGFVKLGAVYSQFIIGRDTPDPPVLSGPFCVTYATGAMMMLRRSTIDALGTFRHDFFMYFEDVEFCLRVLRGGKSIVIVPDARAKTLANLPFAEPSRKIQFHKFKNFFALHLIYLPFACLPEFLARYAGLNLLRYLFRDREAAIALIKSQLWIAVHLRALLMERRRLATTASSIHLHS